MMRYLTEQLTVVGAALPGQTINIVLLSCHNLSPDPGPGHGGNQELMMIELNPGNFSFGFIETYLFFSHPFPLFIHQEPSLCVSAAGAVHISTLF